MVNALTLSWRICILMMLASIFITIPTLALASSTNPMEDVFCLAAVWMTGIVGRAIATLCVAIAGLGAMLGKTSWGLVMLVGANVSTVFAAAAIVDILAGSIPVTTCETIISQQGQQGANFSWQR